MFKITDEWIAEFSTNGTVGWTAKQLRAIGAKYPPRAGWRLAAVGRAISDRQRETFETVNRKAKRRIEAAK